MILRSFLFLIVALAASPALAAGPVTPEMFGALPTVSEAAISQDGQTIAQIQSKAGVRAVAFYDIAQSKPAIGVKLGTVKARDLRWVGPDHVFVLVSASLDVAWGRGIETIEIWRWVSINRNDGAKAFPFKTWTSGAYNFGPGWVYSPIAGDPRNIVMGQWVGGQMSLYRINLATGSDHLLENGLGDTENWIVSATGKPLIRIDWDGGREEFRFYRPEREGGRFKLKSTAPQKREDDALFTAYGPAEADNLLFAAMSADGYWSLCTFDVDTAQRTRCDLSIPGYDVDGGMIEFATNRVVGVRYAAYMQRVRFIDPELASVQESLERALPNASPRITSWSNDRQKFIVDVEYDDHPPQIFVFDRAARKLTMWAPTYADLDGKAFAVRQKYDYQTSDGLDIRGYLTVPAGASKRSMPLIVLPHGGPEARDDQGFDWWAYFYAARGYLVYQPNFRGSFGYGDAFRKAGFLQWGKKMQDDITEGVQHLIDDGVADPARICIVGASYGGYAALVGATLTPDIYACTVSVAGVSSLPAMIAYETGRQLHEDAWDVRIGARVSDNAALQAVSPYYQAARAKAPILLIHGKDDTVVPFDQSTLMRDALMKAKKPFEFVELAAEDHWLSSGETRTQMLSKSIEFIDKHIGAPPPAN